MKIDSLSNQSGEVVIGVMVAVMVVMMLIGGMGMHMMHGDQRHADDHDRVEHKHDHQNEGTHQMHNCMEESPSVHDEDTGSQK
jgi:flagellar basal body-associated protein FliL